MVRFVHGRGGVVHNRAGDLATRSWLARGAVALSLCGLLAGCGGGGGHEDARVINAGQVDIKLPEGYKVVHGKVVAPGSEVAATTPATDAASPPSPADLAKTKKPKTSGTTIPLDNKQDAGTALLAAFGKFRTCIKDEGVKFIGAPDPSKPDSPTNDPNYIKSLSTCAARSGILQALKAGQAEEADLTPAEIKKRNKGYLKWRQCMINRDWKIPKPTPDAQGRLFSFSQAANGSAKPPEPPPGKDIFTSNDIQECAAKAQKVVGQ
jgi:hypothetical protein